MVCTSVHVCIDASMCEASVLCTFNFFSCLGIGHNWGSLHDNAADGCGTQYLMHAFAHSGNHQNNFVNQLSICNQITDAYL